MLKALRITGLLKIKAQGNISGGVMSDLYELMVFDPGLPCPRHRMGPTNGYQVLKLRLLLLLLLLLQLLLVVLLVVQLIEVTLAVVGGDVGSGGVVKP